MTRLNLPLEVTAVFHHFRTCELSTLARDGTPITWPTLPFYDAANERFIVTTSIGLPVKVFNVRRDPRVALLFSDPTACGLQSPPAVLVQGDAEAPDDVLTDVRGFESAIRTVYERQPASAFYSRNRLTRALFDWYYMRVQMLVMPRRVLWWPDGDFTCAPHELEASYVG